ncbi:hypothetical protein HMPREF1144_4532 [Klebsiella sp. OBRC7]|nr:hypothetical protein HMPREF1144_4532 [Klebsiella sp. OBRC7]
MLKSYHLIIICLSITHDASGIYSHKMSALMSRYTACVCYNNNIASMLRFLIMLKESLAFGGHAQEFIM